MPLYVGDYLRDTQHLSAEEHGAYLLLIMHYWTHGSLPQDEKFLQKISQLSGYKWQKYFENISGLFGPGWTHKRIEAEREKAMKLTNKRKMAGELGGVMNALRWEANAKANAKKNGKQMPTQSQRKNNTNLESSGPMVLKEPPKASPELSASLQKLASLTGCKFNQ